MATTNLLARTVHNKAQSAAESDLTKLHYDKYRSVYLHFDRRTAVKTLREMYPGHWQVLHEGWVEHFKKELGWEDGRPAGNRERHRGNKGKFVK